MVKKLYEFLKNLSDEEANEIWNYLDGDPDVVSKMIKVISDNHKNLN